MNVSQLTEQFPSFNKTLGFDPEHCKRLGIVVQVGSSRAQKVNMEGSGIQGQSQFHEFKTILVILMRCCSNTLPPPNNYISLKCSRSSISHTPQKILAIVQHREAVE